MSAEPQRTGYHDVTDFTVSEIVAIKGVRRILEAVPIPVIANEDRQTGN